MRRTTVGFLLGFVFVGAMPAGNGEDIATQAVLADPDGPACAVQATSCEPASCQAASCGCGAPCYEVRPCCCCCCDEWGHFSAGAGVYYLQPRWTTNPALVTTQAVAGVVTTTQTDFSYDLEVAPLIWAAYNTPCGIGVAGRGWWYEGDDAVNLVGPGAGVTINSAAPLGLRNTSTTAGDVLTFESSLEIQVADLMLTYATQMGCGAIEAGVGARYARIEQAYRHVEDPAANDLLDIIDSSHAFEGVGPALGLHGRLCVTSQLSLSMALRYALVIGEHQQDATSVADNVLIAQRSQASDDFRSISELELGGDYAVRFGCGEVYVAGAFVVQHWDNAGNSSNTNLIPVLVDPEVADKNADLLLWGFRAEAGLRF